MKKNCLFVLLFLTCLVFSKGQESQSSLLRLEDYLDMESVSSPQVSPDGKTIVYTRSWTNTYEDRRENDLWIMESDGSRNRYFMKGSSPLFSPDGSKLAFIAEGEPKGSQLFVKFMDSEGPATQITRLDKSPSNLKWSPDGRYLSFTMIVPENKKWPVKLPARPEGARWTEEPLIVEDLVYRRDRVGFLEEGYTQLFIVPSTGGKEKQITSGPWDQGSGGYSWMPDGKSMLYSSLRIPEAEYAYRESEIYSVRIDNLEIQVLTDRKGPDFDPVVSPSGKFVVYRGYDWTDDTYINARIYLMNADGTGKRLLTTEPDRPVSNITWAPEESGIYFNVADQGTSNLYFCSTGGKMRKITEGNHLFSMSTLSRTGFVTGTLSTPVNPVDIAVLDLKKPAIRQISFVNEDILGSKKLGMLEEIRYHSTDNLEIQGWIIKPPDFDPSRKYPLILVIHGGPHAMYSVGFNLSWQLHAAEGYVVLYTNPRGSTGYGSAFANAIKNDYPNKDYEDLMKGVDEVLRLGFVDKKNLFVYGGSGGGVLTSWIVGHTSRFAAASVNYPVINWLSFVGTTDGASWYYNFARLPWDDPSEHLRRSPLMFVGNVTTPTLLMTGVKDLRTPISQTEEFYQALKMRKIPTAMIRFNEEFHGTSSKPSNFLRTLSYLHYWFDKYKTESGD